jgi:3D (Asp-Asp-Asp) domain-containing protein
MAARYRDGNNFDIWMADEQEAREWGVQKLTVTVYEN